MSKPFYHGHFGYSTHVKSKQQQKKHQQPPLSNHPTPPPYTGDPRPSHTCVVYTHAGVTTGAPQEMSTHKASRISFPETYSDCGVIFQETTAVPQKKKPFQQEKDRDLPIPIFQGTCWFRGRLTSRFFSL